MSSGNGDRPDPTIHIDTVRFLRLLPASREAGLGYETGVALFLGCIDDEDDAYCLSLSEDDARQLASDLNDHFAGFIDIHNPNENYGNPEG